jgi:hypothetical protein
VDLKIDGFFYSDFQRIARMRFSQPLRGGYNKKAGFTRCGEKPAWKYIISAGAAPN